MDSANGRVYVGDKRNSRIDVFDSAGSFLFAFGWGVADGVTNALQTCTVTCFKGIAGPGAGQLSSGELTLAVDNDPASPSFHDLYVGERDNFRVQKFDPTGAFVLMLGGGVNKTNGKDICTKISNNVCGIGAPSGGDGKFNHNIMPAAGPGGVLLVADTGVSGGQEFESVRVQSFEPSGEFISQLVLLDEPSLENSFAVDSTGGFYIGFGGAEGKVEKYDSAGNLFETRVVRFLNALAVDSADHLFASEGDNGSPVITEYDPAGNILHRFGYGSLQSFSRSLGASSVVPGDVYAAETLEDQVRYLTAPPPGPLPCCLAPVVGNTKATLKGQVNPEGKATTYHFDYVTEESFEDEGGFASPKTVSTPESASIGADFSLHPAEAAIGCATPTDPPQPECLLPETDYRYRLVATNVDGKGEVEGQLTTKNPFEILQTFATAVDIDSATLNATINPLGIPATGYFEYVTEAQFQDSGFDEASKAPNVDAAETPIDFGAGEVPVVGSVTLPDLDSNTAYRYRIVVSDSFVDEELGPVQSFTTFPPQPKIPPCPNDADRIGPGAHLPDCRAYEMVSPVDKNGGDIKVLGSTLNYPARLEQSSTDGSRFAFSSVTAFANPASAPWTSEYLASRIEGKGWETQPISPARESNSLTLVPAFKYDVQYKTFSPDLGSGWLIHDTNPPLDECAPADTLNLYRRDNVTGSYEALTTAFPTNVAADGYELELQGVSADEAHAVFRANGKLLNKALAGGQSQLYMHVKDPEGGCGELKLVSVLPNGSAAGNTSLGTFDGIPGETRENAVKNTVSVDGSRVFWSATASGIRTLYLRDMTGAGKTVLLATNARYEAATPDGSKGFYASGENLFEVDSAKALAGEPGASTLIAEGSQGTVALSDDASRLYFVSTKALNGEGKAGTPNLYLREGGTTSLVATLYGGDATLLGGDLSVRFPHEGFAQARISSIANGVRASADGSHLVFVSAGSPTGYDNTDVADGRKALEVYLYDLATDKLACISCNPTGARPEGRAFDSTNSSEVRRVSGQLPAGYNQFATPRALTTDANHLFFESFEALVPSDKNKAGDVYEWTRASGQEACEAQGAELFVPKAGGCLSLISSGLDETDSSLADMSPDGHDVFIRTGSSLLPQDPGQVDIYDARILGGLPVPPPPPPGCETPTNPTPCPGAAPAGPPAQTPASAALGTPDQFVPKTCPKGKVRKGNKCVKKCPKGKVLKGKKCVKKGKKANKNKQASKQRANNNRGAGR